MLCFENLPEELTAGTKIICSRLHMKTIQTTIYVKKCDRLSVGFKAQKGYINYCEKHHFFRLLGLFIQHFKGKDFHIEEKACFDTLSCMLDVSRGSALTVQSICEYFEYMALMGYNQFLLYAEDMYEIKERPYFGYLRGRYSYEELKAIDDYAYNLGIEVVPCIQTLGHLEAYLRWDEAADLRENGAVILPEYEKTYEFIEQMIKNACATFRTRKIHVGMDETHGLGLGRYLTIHGYTEPKEIFVKHVNRVAEIADKLGLEPMMWSDMLFCLSSPNYAKYERETQLSRSIIECLPKNMKLVYWQYGDKLDADEYMIDKHLETGLATMYTGAVWIWGGPLPDNTFSSIANEIALETCKRKGLKEVMISVWVYGTGCYHTSLLEMQRYAELTYNDDSSHLSERFEFCTGASYEAFVRMSDFHALYMEGKDYDVLPYGERFWGNKIMWQDLMLGIVDAKLWEEPRSGHYRNAAKVYQALVARHDKWEGLYQYCRAVFEYMSVKCEVAETLIPAYKAHDVKTLSYIADVLLPKLLEKSEDVHYYHRLHKEKYLRPFGLENMDQIWGGMKERCRMSRRRIKAYLNSEVDVLEELEQERLPIQAAAWGWSYKNLAFINSSSAMV